MTFFFLLVSSSTIKIGEREATRAPAGEVAVPPTFGGLLAHRCEREWRLSTRRCRLGTRVSRVTDPGGFGEVVAAASWQNKFSRTLPRPVGAPLWRQRRTCGGWSPCVEALFWSRPPATHRSEREIGMSVFSFGDENTTFGFMEDGRVEQVSSCPPQRRSSTASLDPRSTKLGVHPSRWTTSDGFNSSVPAGVLCISSQCLEATELRLIWGWQRRASSGGGSGIGKICSA